MSTKRVRIEQSDRLCNQNSKSNVIFPETHTVGKKRGKDMKIFVIIIIMTIIINLLQKMNRKKRFETFELFG